MMFHRVSLFYRFHLLFYCLMFRDWIFFSFFFDKNDLISVTYLPYSSDLETMNPRLHSVGYVATVRENELLK